MSNKLDLSTELIGHRALVNSNEGSMTDYSAQSERGFHAIVNAV